MSKSAYERTTTPPRAATRRSVLTGGIAATAALGALPAIATEAEDPTLPFYREWQAAAREFHRCWGLYGSYPDNEGANAASEREYAAERAIAELTPTTMAGFAACAHLLWDGYGQHNGLDDPITRLILAIWRGATGDSQPPERPGQT